MSGKRKTKKMSEATRRAIRTLVGVAFVLVLGVQSARVVERNMSVSRDVAREDAQIRALQVRRQYELRTIARLQRPDGVVPEIHNRLKYAADGEAIVFLRRPGDGANAVPAGDPSEPGD